MEEGPVQTDDFGIPGSGELWPDNERTGTPVQDTPATLEAPGGESRPAAPQSSAPAIHQERQPIRPGDISDLDQILRLAASYGASTLYLASNAPPAIRIDGDLRVLFHTPVPAPHEVESLLLRLVLAHNCDVQRLFDRSAWSFDIPEVGRISCVSFHDERGPGAVFRIRRQDSKGAEPFALPSELQSIASTRDGLVLVAGPRGSGKRATMGAVLNAVLRNRRAYAITVERDDLGVDPEAASLISRRIVIGDSDELLTETRAALRENPDVLLLQEIRSAALMTLALEAAAGGQLVIAGFTTPTAVGVLDRILKLYPTSDRQEVQLLMSQHLRAIIGQVQVRSAAGGRLPVRQVLLNTPALSAILSSAPPSQWPVVFDAARDAGALPLTDALLQLVESGAAAAEDALQHAPDPVRFVEGLKRRGIDARTTAKQP